MIPCHSLDFDRECNAVVMTLGAIPKDTSVPLFLLALLPEDNTSLKRLQGQYDGRLEVSHRTETSRLIVTLPCPRVRSKKILRERAEVLGRRIRDIFGLQPCVAVMGYLELCKYLPDDQLTHSCQKQHAGGHPAERMRAH